MKHTLTKKNVIILGPGSLRFELAIGRLTALYAHFLKIRPDNKPIELSAGSECAHPRWPEIPGNVDKALKLGHRTAKVSKYGLMPKGREPLLMAQNRAATEIDVKLATPAPKTIWFWSLR